VYARAVHHGALVAITLLVTVSGCPVQDALEKYEDRSKVAEAQTNLRMLANDVQMAMQNERMGPDGTMIFGRAPTTVAPPTPPLGTCCANEDKRCAPDPSLWQGEPWATLNFELGSPHYFSYEYIPENEGRAFTLKAHGDLDCDGVFMVVTTTGHWDEALGQPVIDPPEELVTLE
jgi:hypothetical protein